MRLERLEVGGFGSLSDLDIDFHPRLTVIVGENESGKSTVHRALRAALYGVDAGGPGRPAERSDWSRWSPWAGATYALALT
nr:ATP-binding protein [Candidatus Dormibacteraeota bacterium]